jgi:hypothetical protein
MREKWITLYDYNYVDKEIIGGLMNTKQKLSELIKFIKDKATFGFSTKEKEKENESEQSQKQEINSSSKLKSDIMPSMKAAKKPVKQITIPEPFNLSVNKPRILQEPMAISNHPKVTPLPLANYQKTSLKEIEKERKNRLEIIKKNIISRTEKDRNLYTLQTDNRPNNLEKIKEEVENEIQKTLQFNNKYAQPMKDFSKFQGDVKYNETAIIREEYLIDKKKKEEEAALKKILIEKKDSKEFDRWVSEMKIRDDILRMEEVDKRKLELELNREIATNFFNIKKNRNQLKQAQHKQQEKLNLQKIEEQKKEDIKNKKKVIKEIHKVQENAMKNKLKFINDNKELYKNRKKELNELNLITQEEKKIYNQRRDDLICQIRELEKLPIRRQKGFDPTETPGYGFLEEMSLVELKERLALQKKMLLDEINSKKEENKLKMQERADDLINKALIIQENRDKYRNQKELERKMKKEEKDNLNERYRIEREKNILNYKQKIEKKKKQLKDEDEIFQKKIREIKLQQQFNQLGRDAVEFKQFQNIEDGMEKKVNNKQNQYLIDQLAEEKVNWGKVNIRYNNAKKDNKYFNDLLGNYNNSYLMSSALDDMINEEDKKYKKAVYDRERALHKYLQEDIKEKNKFIKNYNIDNSGKKNRTVSKSVDMNKKSATNIGNIENDDKNNKQEKIEEGDEDEENDIQNKLNEENKMENKELIQA